MTNNHRRFILCMELLYSALLHHNNITGNACSASLNQINVDRFLFNISFKEYFMSRKTLTIVYKTNHICVYHDKYAHGHYNTYRKVIKHPMSLNKLLNVIKEIEGPRRYIKVKSFMEQNALLKKSSVMLYEKALGDVT